MYFLVFFMQILAVQELTSRVPPVTCVTGVYQVSSNGSDGEFSPIRTLIAAAPVPVCGKSPQLEVSRKVNCC